jgi:Domain of unknown function (DUF4372)
LTTKSQLVALLYGQLSGASSLREIVTGLASHAVRLYHLGADPVQRSTLSDANALRPNALFAELLAWMMRQAHRGLRRKLAETIYLIDSTSVRLNAHSADWARFSAGVCGAKVHVAPTDGYGRLMAPAGMEVRPCEALRPVGWEHLRRQRGRRSVNRAWI